MDHNEAHRGFIGRRRQRPLAPITAADVNVRALRPRRSIDVKRRRQTIDISSSLQCQMTLESKRYLDPTRYYLPEERIGYYVHFHRCGDVQLVQKLGSGAYGVVYEGISSYGCVYAIKVLTTIGEDGVPVDNRQQEFQKRESRIHQQVTGHENIISVCDQLHTPAARYLLLEYCEEGDLFQNIAEKGRYEGQNQIALEVFNQILSAVQYCHDRGIYHRDLKPENILVTNQGQSIKLVDFGLATNQVHSLDHGCGSTFYMSPECLTPTTKGYYKSGPNDVWSLGVILVNLMCGRNPWKEASLEDSRYSSFRRDPMFLSAILPITPEFNQLLAHVFDEVPERRPTVHQLAYMVPQIKFFTTTERDNAIWMSQSAMQSGPMEIPELHGYDSDSSSDMSELLDEEPVRVRTPNLTPPRSWVCTPSLAGPTVAPVSRVPLKPQVSVVNAECADFTGCRPVMPYEDLYFGRPVFAEAVYNPYIPMNHLDTNFQAQLWANNQMVHTAGYNSYM